MKPNGLFILGEKYYRHIYPEPVRERIAQMANICGPLYDKSAIRDHLSALADVEVIFSGWGAPVLDEELLSAAPKLKAVFYGAGTVKHIVTDAFWEREILITSSYAANGEAVAEFTLGQILISLKRGWLFDREYRAGRGNVDGTRAYYEEMTGTYGSTVGIVSLGAIGRRVCELLKPFHIHVLAYDPYVTKEQAAELGAEWCELDELFRRSDAVTLHTPWLKETEGMIRGEHLLSMKKHAAFINTSRGAVVNEPEMIEALQRRPDLQAILDVTYPEPPEADSPLYTLPNVVLTPHIAGAVARGEGARLGMYVVEELRRYTEGLPPRYPVTRERLATMA